MTTDNPTFILPVYHPAVPPLECLILYLVVQATNRQEELLSSGFCGANLRGPNHSITYRYYSLHLEQGPDEHILKFFGNLSVIMHSTINSLQELVVKTCSEGLR